MFACAIAPLLLLGCYQLTGAFRDHSTTPDSPLPTQLTVDRLIRVRLGGRKPKPQTKIQITSPYKIIDTRTQNTLLESSAPLSGAIAKPARSVGIQLADRTIARNDITIIPDRDGSLVIDQAAYRGRLRIVRENAGLFTDNHLDIEAYLRGVLRGELPRHFHLESFKTQAIAARTYALYQKEHNPAGPDFDVFDDESSQMYVGLAGEDPIAIRALTETAGEIGVFSIMGKDHLFSTYYSSTCGGQTQPVSYFKPNDPDAPPLRGNVICTDCYLSKFYRWPPVRITKKDLTKKIVARYPSISRLGTITALKPKGLAADGRLIRIHLDGATGQNETLVAEDFRLCIGGHTLRSTNFTIQTSSDAFTFSDGKGFGHGVGLCQYGMETKARRGLSYRDIFAIYYPDSKIKRAY